MGLLEISAGNKEVIESLLLTIERDKGIAQEELKNSILVSFVMFLIGEFRQSLQIIYRQSTDFRTYGYSGVIKMRSQKRLQNIPSSSKEFTDWYASYLEKNRLGLANWNKDVLDEICLFLEQMWSRERGGKV